MKSEIKIMHINTKLTREGKPYTEVWAVITLNGENFVRKFALFNQTPVKKGSR